jgi:hypothetical protein
MIYGGFRSKTSSAEDRLNNYTRHVENIVWHWATKILLSASSSNGEVFVLDIAEVGKLAVTAIYLFKDSI